jgi:hypothetical protein
MMESAAVNRRLNDPELISRIQRAELLRQLGITVRTPDDPPAQDIPLD